MPGPLAHAVIAVIVMTGALQAQDAPPDPVRQVFAAESSFAATMAKRDLEAFATFLADETVFFSHGAIRGRDAVVAAWRKYFEGPKAPFSWRPETVEVLPSGKLALTSGPVFDAEGRLTNTFTTVWRLEPDGKWRVVFDKGCPIDD